MSTNVAFLFRIPIAVMVCTLFLFCPSGSSSADEVQKIKDLLLAQDKAWNKADIEGFMETYWKSPKLTFSGGGNTTRGWQATLDRYKKGYPPEKMGKLHFDGLEVTLLGDQVALVLGNWHLDLNGEKKTGNFSLVMKKFEERWKIVHDHSSTLEKDKDLMTLAQATNVGRTHLGLSDKVDVSENGSVVKISGVGERTKATFVDRKTGKISSESPKSD